MITLIQPVLNENVVLVVADGEGEFKKDSFVLELTDSFGMITPFPISAEQANAFMDLHVHVQQPDGSSVPHGAHPDSISRDSSGRTVWFAECLYELCGTRGVPRESPRTRVSVGS